MGSAGYVDARAISRQPGPLPGTRAVPALYLYHYDTCMNAVHITQIRPETVSALKRLARSHHRSLQGELRVILERAARMAPEGAADELKLVTVKTGYTGSWRREEIYGADGR